MKLADCALSVLNCSLIAYCSHAHLFAIWYQKPINIILHISAPSSLFQSHLPATFNCKMVPIKKSVAKKNRNVKGRTLHDMLYATKKNVNGRTLPDILHEGLMRRTHVLKRVCAPDVIRFSNRKQKSH